MESMITRPSYPWKAEEGTVCLRKDGRWEGRGVVGYDEEGNPNFA